MKKSATILLVEDNPDDADLTVRAFSRSGGNNRVVIARDGVEALDYLFGAEDEGHAEPPPLPDLVLLDLKLPRLNGLDVLRRIRQEPRTRLLPIVILTSSREEVDIVDGYSAGANSYMRKPVDFREFSSAVKDIASYWLSLNELPPPPAGERRVF